MVPCVNTYLSYTLTLNFCQTTINLQKLKPPRVRSCGGISRVFVLAYGTPFLQNFQPFIAVLETNLVSNPLS